MGRELLWGVPRGDISHAPTNEKALLKKLVSRPSHQGKMRMHFILARSVPRHLNSVLEVSTKIVKF